MFNDNQLLTISEWTGFCVNLDIYLSDKKRLEDKRRINGSRSVKSKTHREKKLLIQKFIKEQSQENEKKHELLESKMDELAAMRQYHINVLQKYIFSVEEVTPPR